MPDIMPVSLVSSLQKAEVKRVSLSENSFRGIPWSRHTWSTKSLAMRWESLPLEAQGDEVDHLGLSVGDGHDGVVPSGREC